MFCFTCWLSNFHSVEIPGMVFFILTWKEFTWIKHAHRNGSHYIENLWKSWWENNVAINSISCSVRGVVSFVFWKWIILTKIPEHRTNILSMPSAVMKERNFCQGRNSPRWLLRGGFRGAYWHGPYTVQVSRHKT